MSGTANNARGGEFATARRGGLDKFELAFIAEKRARGIADAQIAKMLGRSLYMVRSLDKPPERAKPKPAPPVAWRSGLAKVAEKIAHKHDVTVADLIGPSQTAELSAARQEAYWTAYQIYSARNDRRYSTPTIGRFFGNRHHSTVLFGIGRHERRMAEGGA